jgi:rhamnogalacturonyl hydrolase YesR
VKKELTEEEEMALVEKDPIAALCYFVEKAGLTMTLYGVPVNEQELRAAAEKSAHERIQAAICRGLEKGLNEEEGKD